MEKLMFMPSQATVDGMRILDHKQGQKIAMFENIEYAERSGKKLHLQIMVHVPKWGMPMEKHPLVVFVPGSGWHKQNVFLNIPQLVRFAMRGFTIAVVEYRESDIAPFPAQVQDCKTAVRFLRANAEQYGIDTDNISLWGDSSGGHTVLLAGITGDGLLDTDDYGIYSCKANSIIDFFGPTDVAKMCDFPSEVDHSTADSPEGFMLGKVSPLENPDKVKAANPATYVLPDNDCPPVLIMHGDSDAIVPFEQSIIIHEALMKANKYSEFYKLLGAKHGTNEFWTDETYDIVEGFIRRYIS